MAGFSPLPGGCLCGAVRFVATPKAMAMDACHCGMCRRWSAGPLMAVGCMSVSVEDETQLRSYSSSDWADRQFCATCGSSLFYRLKDGSHVAVSAQAFDAPGEFPFAEEIFIDEKPDNYAFAGDRHRMTGAEVFAAFNAGGGA